ncbi:MAG TPA: hypothetical protein PLI16_05525 [Bacteroidales bacterium]|nr:hypothetical protein [Bacteroidales bacterium]
MVFLFPLAGMSQENFGIAFIRGFNPVIDVFGFETVTIIKKKKQYELESKSNIKATGVFVFEDYKLISAGFTDKKGLNLTGGTFENGEGELSLTYKNKQQITANFTGGLLNDTACYYEYVNGIKVLMNKINFKSGYLDGTCYSYDNEGNMLTQTKYEHNKMVYRAWYGFYPESGPFKPMVHKGKIRQEDFYENNKIKRTVIYKTDGTVDRIIE